MSDHFDGKKFFNPGREHRKSFFDFLTWQFTKKSKEWPDWVDDVKQVVPPPMAEEGLIRVTFINHATVLLQYKDFAILTDPHFFERTSPVSFAGPKRVRLPGVRIEDLPKIDLVLISHNHYDHLDISSVKALEKKFSPQFIVPLGDKKVLESENVKKVLEMDWGNSFSLGPVKVNFESSLHWSGRGLGDRNESLWGSYLIQIEKKNIYFAGDTGYADHFLKILNKYGSVDFAMFPIGAYEPRWFMKESHMNPEEAVQAHLDLKSQQSIGIHFGTWKLTDESIDDPIVSLRESLILRKISDKNFQAPQNGQVFEIRL